MAFSTVASAVLHGVQAEIIQVETDVSNGLPVFHMVGYLSSEVKEAAERVRTAIQNCGMQLPPKKIVVNLAPATMRKRGASYDLPIALSVLAAMGVFSAESLRGVVVAGELGLGGAVQKISGILPIVKRAKECGYHTCIVPKENVTEGALVEGVRILGADTLLTVCRYLKGEEELSWASALGKEKWEAVRNAEELDEQIDFCHIRGQEIVKRAAEVAVSGGHNLLLAGPPGSGKSMTAKAITSILPSLSMEESLEITRIYSVLGLLREDHPLITARPFRNVHHTTTKAALVGGGNPPLPGEISLAHGGSLITADMALEEGKDVFALPGLATSPMSRGCHRLIAQGAGILLSPEDLLEMLGYQKEKLCQKPDKNEKMLETTENIVYSCLGLYPKGVQSLSVETGLAPPDLIEQLMTLELQGYIKEVSRNQYIKVR